QYKRTRRHDIFACGWTADLLHELLQTEGENGFGASMAGLWAGDRLTAIEFFTEWKAVYIDYSGRLQRAQIDTTAFGRVPIQ
ncbi:MAG: GNAT family N-acetyltransferase, partial [Thermoflexus sp.]